MKWTGAPLLAAALLLAGCLSFHHEPPEPGATHLGSSQVTVPARLVDNALVIEAKWDKYGPYHFLIDTGSSVTLVTPEFVRRHPSRALPPLRTPQVSVKGPDGGTTLLPPAVVGEIDIGAVRFTDVPVLVYDCASLSADLGVPIDGVLGFPLFRKTLLTLDYPASRVILRPPNSPSSIPGTAIAFNNADKTPIIPVTLGDRRIIALIDSGSDESFSLNPAGLAPRLASGLVQGLAVTTLSGDHPEWIGRLADTLYIGDYAVPRPVAQITDELSSVGGGILKFFTVTFDQEHDQVTFFRDNPDPIAVPGRRSAGMSFLKTPAYWKVVSIVPGSPADNAEVEVGDLVARVNGEPVAKWDPRRYEALTSNAQEAVFTFINGTQQTDKTLKIVDLVP